ncbi:MAG TPA: hypothetical protein VJV78_36325 [Polyangiales bacterium]|nr:hypothetical protein [Polyangiales bacterium]
MDTTRAALAYERGDLEAAQRLLAGAPGLLRAADGEAPGNQAALVHARLFGAPDKRRELAAAWRAQGVHDPDLWAWTNIPVGPRPVANASR